jgi:fermentation-respiration switch protein FrsA (DUF1100 family)
VTGSGPAPAPLRLHPRVDVYHPLGEAHSDKQTLDALAMYRRLFKGGWGRGWGGLAGRKEGRLSC